MRNALSTKVCKKPAALLGLLLSSHSNTYLLSPSTSPATHSLSAPANLSESKGLILTPSPLLLPDIQVWKCTYLFPAINICLCKVFNPLSVQHWPFPYSKLFHLNNLLYKPCIHKIYFASIKCQLSAVPWVFSLFLQLQSANSWL